MKTPSKPWRTPWTPCRYRLFGLFLDFLTFLLYVSFSIANSSFKNKNWYNKVTSYPMDLTWKIFFCSKESNFSTFHFLNLSPVVPNFGASYLPTYQKIPAEIFRKWSFLLYYQFEVGPISLRSPEMCNILIHRKAFTRVIQLKHFSKFRSPIEALVEEILTSKYEPLSSNHWPDIWNWIFP